MLSLRARLIGLFVVLALLVATVIVVAVLQFSAEQVMHLIMEGNYSAAEAQAMFDQYVVQVLLIGAAAAVVVGAVAAWWLVRRIMRPLDQLTEASRSIAVGDLTARVAEPPEAELGRLAQSFNRMAATLERTEHLRRALIEDVAHELRTPLTSLRGYTEALAEGVVEPTPDMLRTVQEEIERLTRLVEELDQLARGEPGERVLARTEVDLAVIVRRTLELASPELAQRQVEVRIEGADAVPALWADPDAIGQVVTNLVQNAERYTDPGGTITVRLRAEGNRLRCSIENTGTEIPPDELELIWERLHRADRSRDRASGGAGIGLAIVRQIVEAHGGTVGASSRDGRTEVWFSLPLAVAS
ncbi:MAG TPA: ATP-binding protein [Candidatus Limnocylindria bacterium]|nr:ATP-binding protein [Candidatus Limnocylindria bacterium]